jgi:hypothetical protein
VLAEYSVGVDEDSFIFEDLRYKTYTLEKTIWWNANSSSKRTQKSSTRKRSAQKSRS